MKKLLIMLFTLVTAVVGFAEDTVKPDNLISLDTVTVTANKTKEDMQKIPDSVSVLTSVDISDRSINNTEDIFERIPNMHFTKMGQTGSSDQIASIRGITSFMTGGSVFGFYIDDVYQPLYDINFSDVERIEVLRGPQGTLYGRNTEAGVINIITKEPKNTWSADINTSYGSFNTKSLFVAGNGAIIRDKLFLRLTGKYSSSDGYFENDADRSDDVDKSKSFDGKLSLKYKPTSDLTIDFKSGYQEYDANYAEFALYDSVMDGDMKVNVDDPGDMSNNTYNSSLKIDYGMGKVRFTSITSAVRADTSNDNDLDFTQYKLMKLETSKDSKIFSQEFRLNSEDNSPLKWRTGAYLYSSEEKQNIDMSMFTYNVVSSQYGKTEKSSAALFGQMDYKIGKFVLTAGLRYENEHQEFDYEWSGGAMVGYTPVKGSAEEDFTALLPKAALMYNINDNSQSYISIAKGFKSGGFNISSEPGKSYDSEYTWNYEVGIKNKLAGGKLVVNAAAFYIDWSDMQVEQPSYPDYIIDNAAEATSKGLELEARFLPAAWLNLYGSFGYVDAEFDDYTLNGVDYSGKKITNSPDTTYSLGGVLRFMDHWFVNAEINGTGKIYYNAANSKEQTSYEIINAKVGYETERFDVYVWVDNLLDQAYATRAFEMSGNWYGRSGNPLTVGANVNLRF